MSVSTSTCDTKPEVSHPSSNQFSDSPTLDVHTFPFELPLGVSADPTGTGLSETAPDSNNNCKRPGAPGLLTYQLHINSGVPMTPSQGFNNLPE